MVFILRWLIISAITYSHSCTPDDYSCGENAEKPKYFSTKTSYDYVSPKKIDFPDDATPVQLFMVIKHGASHPSLDFQNQSRCQRNNVKQLKSLKNSTMCSSDIEAIKNWKPKFAQGDVEEGLVDQGRDHIKELALRVQKAFPSIFAKKYNSENYKVLSRPEKNCLETGQIFVKTILNKTNHDNIPVCRVSDTILLIDRLTDWGNIKKLDNPELSYFIRDAVNEVVKKVVTKIGCVPGSGLDFDYRFVFHLHGICALESAYDQNSISPMCRVFDQEDLDILEYKEDLVHYFDIGYGNPFSVKYACGMARHFLESFENKIHGKGPKGVFQFGKSINILILYVMLGLAKDKVPLMSSNYESMKNRNWKSSSMAPLGANFMAVLYKKKTSIINIQYFVSFYLNEKLTKITLDDGDDCFKCPWLKIKEKLQKYLIDHSCTSAYNIVKTVGDDMGHYPSYSYDLDFDIGPMTNYSMVNGVKEINRPTDIGPMTNYSMVNGVKEINRPTICIPFRMFGVMHHGVIWPSEKSLKEWTRYDAYKYKITARARMCWSDINSFRKYFCGYPDIREFRETDVNHTNQIKFLAYRIRNAFEIFFYDDLKYFKVSTRPEARCKDTGKRFLNSLFKKISNTYEPELENDNQFLMSGELDESDSKNIHIDEIEKFKTSDVIKNVLRRVEIRMGLEPGELHNELDFVIHTYDVCRFRRSIYKEVSPSSCKLFCKEDLEALEYMEDLFWYYTAGYGNPMNSQQVCPTARRFLESFKHTDCQKTDGIDPLFVFHVGNSQNLFNMYVMLGLAKDKAPLRSDNYKDMAERKWRSSSMVPLLANFMAVLFKDENYEFSVAFYFNENPTLITLDENKTCEVCAWTEIEKLLTLYIEKNCDN